MPAHQHEGRDQSERHRHADDEREGQPEDAQAHRRLVEAGDGHRRDRDDHGDGDQRDEQSDDGARRRQDHALGQQLHDDVPGRRANRGATAISRSRPSARVSSSEATLRQPMTNSRPTAPNST